jgi:hypothetical protein
VLQPHPHKTFPPRPSWQRSLNTELLNLLQGINTGSMTLQDADMRLTEIQEMLATDFSPLLQADPEVAEIFVPLNPPAGDPVAWIDGDPVYESDYSQEIPHEH